MTDKPFDPVTDGTPKEFLSVLSRLGKWETAIQARDNAMRRKGNAEGRYEVLVELGQVCNAMKNAPASLIKSAIIAQIAKELVSGKCRAAEKISDPLQVEERCNGKEEE